MSTRQCATLNLPRRYLIKVKALLRRHAPQAEVWAYGSRVTGDSHDASDLDLIARNPKNLADETPHLVKLKEAFDESNLPIRVDVLDWARVPASFHREIERVYVVLQVGDKK